MPSLHWICVLTLAMICCLTAQPVKRSVQDEIVTMLDNFSVKCDAEAKFYTPENVKDNCLVSALNCSLKELDVLIAECELVSGDYDDLLTTLEQMHNENKNKARYNCTAKEFTCEFAPQKKVETYLDSLKSLVQQFEANAK